MADIIRGVLVGFAVGGFAAVVVETNIFAVQALWHFNCLAAKTVWAMAKTHWEEQGEQIKNEDDSEPNES